VQDLRPTAPATVLSGHGGVEVGPHALRWGAFDFKTKPVKVAKLLGATGKAIRSRSLAEEAARREG
jgi:FixJ family two-component response regulator